MNMSTTMAPSRSDRRIELLQETQHRRVSRVLNVIRRSREPQTLWQLVIRVCGEVYGVAAIAVMDVGSRVEYLCQRGYLSLANLEEVERDEYAPFRYRG